MKKQVFLFILSITPFLFFAQSASQLLKEVDQNIQSYNNIVLNFKYAINNNEANLHQETKGNVSLEGQKYVLNLMGTTQLFDGNKLYVINDEDEEVTISTQEEDSFSPSQMLSFYKEGYSAKLDIIQNVNGRKIQYIKLTPTTQKEDVKSILLGVDKVTKHIFKLIISQYNATNISITVNQFKTNQPLSPTLFKYQKEKYEDYYTNYLD